MEPNRQTRRLMEKYTPSPSRTRMKLDTTKILKDWQGTALLNQQSAVAGRKDKPLALGDMLGGHLAQGTNVPKEKRLRAGILSVRIEQAYAKGDKELALSAEDQKLIMEMIDATTNLPAYLVGVIRYFVDPDSLQPDERETMAFFDSPPEADGNQPD